MGKEQIKNESITRQEDDFAQWYTDVCKKAELMDYSSVKGFIIYRPYGFAIWEQIRSYLDARFKETVLDLSKPCFLSAFSAASSSLASAFFSSAFF